VILYFVYMSWSGWNSLGGSLDGDPAVGTNKDGRVEVFVRGSDSALHHIWQTSPNNGWSSWGSLGGNVSNISVPAVGLDRGGNIEVFAVWNDATLSRIEQVNSWSGGWQSMGGDLYSNPAIRSNQDGRLEVFAVWKDRTLRHMWQQ
jgi:acylphosphatase